MAHSNRTGNRGSLLAVPAIALGWETAGAAMFGMGPVEGTIRASAWAVNKASSATAILKAAAEKTGLQAVDAAAAIMEQASQTLGNVYQIAMDNPELGIVAVGAMSAPIMLKKAERAWASFRYNRGAKLSEREMNLLADGR